MQTVEKDVKTYIVFTNSDVWWLQGLLASGFQHCYILKNDGFNWTKIEANRKKLTSTILTHKPEENLPEQLANKDHVLQVSVSQMAIVKKWRFGIFHCVSVVKFFLGIDFFAITPHGLYCRLLKLSRISHHKYDVKFIWGRKANGQAR